MNYKHILLALAVPALLLSCKNKKPTESYCEKNPSECETVSAAKEFFYFNIGSWWVYEEETTHERDSIYVTEQTSNNGYVFYMKTKSALTEYDYQYWPVYTYGNPLCSMTEAVQGKCVYISITKYKPGGFSGQGKCFFVNYKQGMYEVAPTTAFPENKIEVESIFPDYTLGSLNFDQTVKIKEQHTLLENDQETHHYYARGVGLIRKELTDSNQVWNLVSYHIEPF